MFEDTGAALVLGYVASICFTIQYFPQAQLNFQKKSVFGFSANGIIIKLIGACFLASNSFYTEQPVSVIAYGFFNVFQHVIFMIQYLFNFFSIFFIFSQFLLSLSPFPFFLPYFVSLFFFFLLFFCFFVFFDSLDSVYIHHQPLHLQGFI